MGFDETRGIHPIRPDSGLRAGPALRPDQLRLPQTILETDYNPPFQQDPRFDASDDAHYHRNWADEVAGGRAWFTNETPAWEWTPILEPDHEFETKLVGLSGLAVATHLSKEDVPFSHPFGGSNPMELLGTYPDEYRSFGDWNLDVHVDESFADLVAPDNNYERTYVGPSSGRKQLITALTQDVIDGLANLGLPNTRMMHIETDQGLIPQDYRPGPRDRVAVFGRWVVDCGHDLRADGEPTGRFTSEIHPPLIVAGAQSSGMATHSTVVGRPYLVGQEFGDGALVRHLFMEGKRVAPKIPLLPIPFKTQFEARPEVHATPFQGIHIVKYVVRPEYRRQRDDDKLFVRFQFVVRSGVTVQVFDASDSSQDAVGVLISLNDVDYQAAALPPKHDWHLAIDDLDVLKPGLAEKVKGVAAGIALLSPHVGLDPASGLAVSAVLGQGIWTDSYDPPVPPKLESANTTVTTVDKLGGGPHFVHFPEDPQPFPVIGFLDVSWDPFPEPS